MSAAVARPALWGAGLSLLHQWVPDTDQYRNDVGIPLFLAVRQAANPGRTLKSGSGLATVPEESPRHQRRCRLESWKEQQDSWADVAIKQHAADALANPAARRATEGPGCEAAPRGRSKNRRRDWRVSGIGARLSLHNPETAIAALQPTATSRVCGRRIA